MTHSKGLPKQSTMAVDMFFAWELNSAQHKVYLIMHSQISSACVAWKAISKGRMQPLQFQLARLNIEKLRKGSVS